MGFLSSWSFVVMGSSFVNTLLSVLFFFLFPFVNISRGGEPCIIVFQIAALCGFCVFFFFFRKLLSAVRLTIQKINHPDE